MKDSSEVISEFNDVVNMTASELEKWLKSDDSQSAGWPKEDESGESVGHDSGRKIVEILQANPGKDPEKYTEDRIAHMRKVVSYCKRHLAQEEKTNSEKTAEELKKTKSYASLKNWGHDALKKRGDTGDEEDEHAEYQKNAEAGDAKDEQQAEAGDKRKKPSEDQGGANKKRETLQGKASANGDQGENNRDEEEEVSEEVSEEDEDEQNDQKDNKASSVKESKNGPQPGDTVSWNWGNGQPEGKVLDVKEEKTTITTKKGNEVSRDGDPEDPAVVIDTGKSKAVKKNHELAQDV